MIVSGYGAASLSAIASRLGLTKGALGHHFPTKQAFVFDIVAHANDLATASAERARELFPDSALRGCMAFFAGIARAGASDPIAKAALLLYQDRAVPAEVVMPAFECNRRLVSEFLEAHVRSEGGRLRMPVADATRFLQLFTAGELTVSRFAASYSAHDSMASFVAALVGLGVPDAEAVVTDGVRAVWASD